MKTNCPAEGDEMQALTTRFDRCSGRAIVAVACAAIDIAQFAPGRNHWPATGAAVQLPRPIACRTPAGDPC